MPYADMDVVKINNSNGYIDTSFLYSPSNTGLKIHKMSAYVKPGGVQDQWYYLVCRAKYSGATVSTWADSVYYTTATIGSVKHGFVASEVVEFSDRIDISFDAATPTHIFEMWDTMTINLPGDIVLTPVSNVVLSGTDKNKDMIFSWSKPTGVYTRVVFYDEQNVQIGAYDTKLNTLTIPGGTFAQNYARAVFRNYLTSSSSTTFSAELSKTYVLSIPAITNIELTRTDIAEDITLSYTTQAGYETRARVYKDGVVIQTWTLTNGSYFIPKNTLPTGDVTFKLSNISGDEFGTEYERIYSLVNIQPSIATLEPDNVNQNLNTPIVVSWASANQSLFKLTVDGKVYTGTTAKTLTLPANTLTSGTKTMILEVTYIPIWATSTADHRKITKTVSFLAYGNPPTPTLLNKTIISTATPLIKWDSTEQVAYDFILIDGATNLVATGEVMSTAKQYQVAVALGNNKSYAIKLRVKNQYGLWSAYATSTFTTSFVVPNTPTISGFADISNGSIILNIATVTSPEYKNSEIWRKEPYGEWTRMAYNLELVDTWIDNYIRSGVAYEYKARSIGLTGGIAESDAISLSSTVMGYNFYNIEHLGSNINFKYNSEVVPTFNRNEVLTMYAGCSAPSYESDGVIYQTLNMSFVTLEMSDIDKLINLIKATKVFLYKDSKGRKVFGMITGNFSPKTDTSNVTTIAFAFTELNFLEQDVYAGTNTGLKLLMWDGTWRFDGTYAFGGA